LVSHFTFEAAHHTPVFSNELRLVLYTAHAF
jgi:hypothetical protein